MNFRLIIHRNGYHGKILFDDTLPPLKTLVRYGVIYDWRWYEHMDDMCELSKQCPGVLFQLEGYGNLIPWVAWFEDGRSYKEDLQMPVFDSSKLE